jgi:hypothetical protein
MLSRSRFLLSLVVALSLSTLALADSVSVSNACLHSSASFSGGSHVYSVSENEKWDSHTSVSPSGNKGFFLLHGTISRKNGNWGTWHVGTTNPKSAPTPLATPEPESLMLLSTGLVGIAGVLRRKLHLA